MFPRGRWRERSTRAVMAALAVAVGAALLAGGAAGCTSELTDTARVRVGSRELLVEVADDAVEQARGLIDRPRPDDGTGMLFAWDKAGTRAFTLHEIDYEIDVIFIGSDRRVVEVLPLVPGGPEEAQSVHPAKWVIEVPGGWAERYGVGVGDEFEIVESVR